MLGRPFVRLASHTIAPWHSHMGATAASLHGIWTPIMAGQQVPVGNDDAKFVPIHEADIHDQLEDLLGAATIPATIVNWEVTRSSAPVNGLSISESSPVRMFGSTKLSATPAHLRRYKTPVDHRSVSGVVARRNGPRGGRQIPRRQASLCS